MTVAAHKSALAVQLRLYGESLSYSKTEGTTVLGPKALRGQTMFRESSNGNEGSRITRSTDFIFDADAFRTAVGRWPHDGDKLTVTPRSALEGLSAVTYRVTAINGEPVYRLEPTGTRLRIHTNEYTEA